MQAIFLLAQKDNTHYDKAMCGRITFTETDGGQLKERFQLKKLPENLQPRYNIAPSQNIPAILNTFPNELKMVRWGLIPSWAEDEKLSFKMINARAETIFDKPAYRSAIRRRRCLILADSFFEWQKTNGKKQPYRIILKDQNLFALAGIWDVWKKNGQDIPTCSIITTSPNTFMREFHDRMPVILEKDKEREWLSDMAPNGIAEFLKPYRFDNLQAYQVGLAVNSPAIDTPDVIRLLE